MNNKFTEDTRITIVRICTSLLFCCEYLSELSSCSLKKTRFKNYIHSFNNKLINNIKPLLLIYYVVGREMVTAPRGRHIHI